MGGPRNDGHLRAGFSSGLRQRKAHFARACVGDSAHRVDRLEGGARSEQHTPACKDLGLAGCNQRRQQGLGLQHASGAVLLAGELAGVRAQDGHTVGRELRRVPLCSGLRPHLAVHGGRGKQRTLARKAQGGEEVVGPTLRKLGQEVGRRGRNDDGIGAAREADVAHRVVGAGFPQIHRHRPAGERLECERCDEARGSLGHHDVDGYARLDEQAGELRGFIGGDATSDPEYDATKRRAQNTRRARDRSSQGSAVRSIWAVARQSLHCPAAGFRSHPGLVPITTALQSHPLKGTRGARGSSRS